MMEPLTVPNVLPADSRSLTVLNELLYESAIVCAAWDSTHCS